MEIFKSFRIEAAHRLPNVPAGHKCARLHGHSFVIGIYVAGPVASETGWGRDFADLGEAMAEGLEALDHRYLNEVAARQLIDRGFHAGVSAHISRYFFGLLAVVAVMGLASATRYYLVTWIGERVVADVRDRVFSHVLALSSEFFEKARTGELLSRLTGDTTLVQTVVGSSASFALRSIVMAIGAFVMMAVTSPKLTALASLSVPVVLISIIVMGRRVRGLSRAAQDRIAETSALASEGLSAMPTLQADTHENVDRERFASSTELAFATAIRRTKVRAAMTAAVFMLVGSCIVLVLWVGAQDLQGARMSSGQLLQFVLYALIF